jgi:large subunit ribosomal protein L18
MNTKLIRKQKRHKHIRKTVSGTMERPRLVVARSNVHIYAQIIDDVTGVTLASASDLKLKAKGTPVVKAQAVGEQLAQIAKEKNITKVVFDRGGYKYHGRVKALADGARTGGLEF